MQSTLAAAGTNGTAAGLRSLKSAGTSLIFQASTWPLFFPSQRYRLSSCSVGKLHQCVMQPARARSVSLGMRVRQHGKGLTLCLIWWAICLVAAVTKAVLTWPLRNCAMCTMPCWRAASSTAMESKSIGYSTTTVASAIKALSCKCTDLRLQTGSLLLQAGSRCSPEGL